MHDTGRRAVICMDKGLCQAALLSLYLSLPFARALSPLAACNSAQISEEAGRLIFSLCMAKERGHALTPGSQLLNPPPRPAEGKGKHLSVLASYWCGEGCSDVVLALSQAPHKQWALTAGLGVLVWVHWGGTKESKTLLPPQC